mmetsp:Transcript_24464/g.45223  ORF Transcript_24464/g.45223 Transcript_24464/m.45223 type:complete len:123 (-) Transcript_24464:467-835(-)
MGDGVGGGEEENQFRDDLDSFSCDPRSRCRCRLNRWGVGANPRYRSRSRRCGDRLACRPGNNFEEDDASAFQGRFCSPSSHPCASRPSPPTAPASNWRLKNRRSSVALHGCLGAASDVRTLS